MKHTKTLDVLFLVLLFLFLCRPAFAGPIDVTQARRNAMQFRQNTTPTGMRKAPGNVDMQHVYTQYTADGQPAVYVFTTGQQGYVMASANDEAMAVLAYSTEGTFDANNIPEGMSYMMQQYAAEIATLDTRISVPSKAPARVLSTERIDPLLGEIKWDQLPPYNLLCPNSVGAYGDGQYNAAKASTGCMTTALAQIMYYYRHPQRGQGSIEFEVKVGAGTALWSVDLYDDYYDWDAMANHRSGFATVNGSYDMSNPGVSSVAKLMRDIGLALRTVYGLASGASRSRLLPAIVNYFDYDAKSIEHVERSRISTQEEWDSLVLAELRQRRPVYLEGYPGPGAGGHAFVCDGYDGNGFFHINWGWSGKSNDYFLMTALNPNAQGVGGGTGGYNYDMAMIRGLKPRPEGQAPFRPYLINNDRKATRPGTFDKPGMWVAHDGDDDNSTFAEEFPLDEATDYWFAGEFCTPWGSNMDIRARLGVLVVKPNGEREIAWDNSGNPVMLFYTHAYYRFHVNMKESWKQPGTRIFYIYDVRGGDGPALVRNGANLVCSFSVVERGEELVAQIDRSEPTSAIDISATPIMQRQSFFTNGLVFPYDMDSPRENRRIGTIGITVENTGKSTLYTVDNRKMYRDMTDDAIFKVPAGSTIKPTIRMAQGDWMHGYFYIDYDRNRTLTANTTGLSQANTELVAYSYWTGDVTNGKNGSNSANQPVADNNTLEMPSFKAPDQPGTYYVRFKVDWNCTDPAGNPGYMEGGQLKNSIVSNGGAIVDAKLIVTAPLPPPAPADLELAAAYQNYKRAEAEYYAFKEKYEWEENYQAYQVAKSAILELAFYTGWRNGTAKEFNKAASAIDTKLAEATAAIYKILGIVVPEPEPEPQPDPQPQPEPEPGPTDPTLSNAHLSDIFVGHGTTSLQLYPAFNPDVHFYLARRSDKDFDMPGSCYISPYYKYTISGTSEHTQATVRGSVTNMLLMPDWNRVTLTCTAPDGKTTEDYHIILLSSSGGSTADPSTKPVSILDVSLMLHMLQPEYGYSDTMFGRYINKSQLERLVQLLLNRP